MKRYQSKIVRSFILVVLKNLVFTNSKNYFIYFNTALYDTPYISSVTLAYHPLKKHKTHSQRSIATTDYNN